jgi:CRP/FNR family transcriptional regulator, cyclic AMP receptor protein
MNPVTPAEVGRISLFAGLPDDELAGLASVAVRRRLDDGATLFEQGQPASTLHVVVGGGLVLRADAGRRSVIVETLRPGDLVGWSAMRGGATTLSTARAVGPTEVIAIPVDPIVALAAGGSKQAETLVRRIVALAAGHLEASWTQLLQVGSEGVISAG